jgi:hypothetical protein
MRRGAALGIARGIASTLARSVAGFSACLLLSALAWPAPARANWMVDWVPTVGTGGTYFDVKTTDPGSTPIEDVENRQQLDNSLSLDNAYVHLGVQYEVMRVALQQNQNLNYLDHQVGMNFNVDRWLKRYTEDGRLTLTATARVSPSLPPLDPKSLPTGVSGRDTQGQNDLTPSEYFVHHDVLNIRDNPTGYTLLYGANYGDQVDPFNRYNVGWDIEDNRYNSTLVRDSRVLHLQGTYAVRLRQGEVGTRISHLRELGSARLKDLYGLSVFRSAEARRVTWHVEPGITYQPADHLARSSLNVSWAYTMRRATFESAYTSTWSISVIGADPLQRIHTGYLAISTNHNYRSPRWISLGGRWEQLSRRLEVSAGQRFQIRRSLAVVFQYSNSSVWWDNGSSPHLVSWRSQTIGGDLRWEF